MYIDPIQGTQDDGDEYGYIGLGSDRHGVGGWFFSWRATLSATIDSIEEDTIDRPGRHVSSATLSRLVRRAWRERYGSCRADAVARKAAKDYDDAVCYHG